MIYTITFNPAVDYIVYTEGMEIGKVNRSKREEVYVGGKGINVSFILKELGISSKALGFVAGFTGAAIQNEVSNNGIETDFVNLDEGTSRINVKIKSLEETELNGQGPDIPKKKVDELFCKLNEVNSGDTVILAGSIPSSLPSDIYEKILKLFDGKGVSVVVDATKDLLLNVLKYKPFLIKPNKYELEELFGVSINTTEDVVKYAKELKKMGAVNVLVSMAGEGAVLVDEYEEVHSCGVCKGVIKNSVGAGDSMVAGFVAGCSKGDYGYALKLGTACGGATAFSEGLAKKEKIEELMEQLN